jgi:hypothetical protein
MVGVTSAGTNGGGHSHIPALHTGPPTPQALPHAPQFRLSTARSVQTLPQTVAPHSHIPALHANPRPQVLPQPPQLKASLDTSVQAPGVHSCSGAWHVGAASGAGGAASAPVAGTGWSPPESSLPQLDIASPLSIATTNNNARMKLLLPFW